MKINLSLQTLMALALCSPGLAQGPNLAKLDRFFDKLAEENKAMGSLTIARDGAVQYARAIGFSQIDGDKMKPATVATRYRIASVTKMFTATMIFQLIDEGSLALDDTLDKFFPQIPNAARITISQMLAHRSGIHDFTEDRAYHSWKTKPKSPDEIINLIARSSPDFEPDQKTGYSNSGYVLLGYLVERIEGTPYQEALARRISEKVGLKDTYLGTGHTDPNMNESFSFQYGHDWEQQAETHLSIASGAGALISTPTDLTRFIQALFDLKLVSRERLDQMMRHECGMNTFTYHGKTLYGHTGGVDNFGSWLVYLPEEKLAVAYTANAKVYPVEKIVDGVFDIYWNRPFEIPTFESVFVSPEILDQYVGVYSSPKAPVTFTVTRDNATLLVQMTGQSANPLEATAPNEFKIERAGIVLEFDASKGQMILKRGGRAQILTKEK